MVNKIIRLTESDLIRLVKRVVKLTEAEKKRPAKRIVPTGTVRKFDYSEMIDMLKKSKLYNLLDNTTKVRYLNGSIREENAGGGLRLLVYNNDGSVKYNLSLNGYNISNSINLLLDFTKENFLNSDILKELKSIERKTSESINWLIRQTISLIMEREALDDTIEDMVDRWFDYDYSHECRLIKQASDEVIEEMKKRYSNEIAWYYGVIRKQDELDEVVSKIFDDCKNN